MHVEDNPCILKVEPSWEDIGLTEISFEFKNQNLKEHLDCFSDLPSLFNQPKHMQGVDKITIYEKIKTYSDTPTNNISSVLMLLYLIQLSILNPLYTGNP